MKILFSYFTNNYILETKCSLTIVLNKAMMFAIGDKCGHYELVNVSSYHILVPPLLKRFDIDEKIH